MDGVLGECACLCESGNADGSNGSVCAAGNHRADFPVPDQPVGQPEGIRPVAQDEVTLKFGPMIPVFMEIWAGAPSNIIIGIIKGLTRFGPFAFRMPSCCDSELIPPTPLPTRIPISYLLESSIFNPAFR